MKKKNWMFTIFNEENFPVQKIRKFPHFSTAWTQLETTERGKLHWQTLVVFKQQVTLAALKAHKVKEGNLEGWNFSEKDDWRHLNQGLQYVSGYGPKAMSKLWDPQQRYVVYPLTVRHTPVTDEHMAL